MASWKDKVVVVAGGSKGIGLQIAKAFQLRGARIVLLARDESRLNQVVETLNETIPDSTAGFGIDLRDQFAVKQMATVLQQEYVSIDVWVNAVGQSTRTTFLESKLDDYQNLMDQNFFTSVIGSLAAIEIIADSNGHLINIGSLASKTAWPFLAPYVASKHALAGFANQLRLEGPDNIHYLFVCPGPIAAEVDAARYQEESPNLPEHAHRPGAGAPVKAIDGKWLAKKIVNACEKRKPELVVPYKSRFLFSILQIWPSLGDWLIRRHFK